MRTRTRGSKALLVAAAAFALAPSIQAMASDARGSIALVDPVSMTAYSHHVPFQWSFTPGTRVKTTSKVYFQASNDGYRWQSIRTSVPINNGSYVWDTSDWDEGSYRVRSVVHKTLVLDKVGPIVVDRTAPVTYITSPREGDVVIEDALTVSNALVVGTTTLEAEAFDFGSGVNTIEWYLNENFIGEGSPFEYNFSMEPGRHILTVTVSDVAGNQTSASMQLTAAPGPSLIAEGLPGDDLPEPPEDLPGLPDESCLPEEAPGLPGLPEGEEPSLPALPESDCLPGAPDPEIPDPSELPGAPDPSELPGLPEGLPGPDDLPGAPDPGDLPVPPIP